MSVGPRSDEFSSNLLKCPFFIFMAASEDHCIYIMWMYIYIPDKRTSWYCILMQAVGQSLISSVLYICSLGSVDKSWQGSKLALMILLSLLYI